MDAISGKHLSWVDTCSHTCANRCCLTTDVKPASLYANDASLYSKVRIDHCFGGEAVLAALDLTASVPQVYPTCTLSTLQMYDNYTLLCTQREPQMYSNCAAKTP